MKTTKQTEPTVTEPESTVQFVKMVRDGQFIEVHQVLVQEHLSLGWNLADGTKEAAGGGISDADLVSAAKVFLEAWAADRRREGWSSADIASGQKTTHIKVEFVDVINGDQRLTIHPGTLANHIALGWLPVNKTILMTKGGKKISIIPHALETLLKLGWEIYQPPEFLGQPVPWPPICMWKSREKIEVHITAVLEHARLGWSLEPLAYVISEKGAVLRIRVSEIQSFLKNGWKSLEKE